jgi:hypothetical protein
MQCNKRDTSKTTRDDGKDVVSDNGDCAQGTLQFLDSNLIGIFSRRRPGPVEYPASLPLVNGRQLAAPAALCSERGAINDDEPGRHRHGVTAA